MEKDMLRKMKETRVMWEVSVEIDERDLAPFVEIFQMEGKKLVALRAFRLAFPFLHVEQAVNLLRKAADLMEGYRLA